MSVAPITINKPYQQCCNYAGMRGSGKSNAMAFVAQRLPRDINFTLIDLSHVHHWRPYHPHKQKIIHLRGDYRTEFERLIDQVWREGNHVLMVEEIDRFQTVHKMPTRLDDIINLGRNRGISLWLSFRRPQRVHNDLIENADHHFIFRMFGTAVDWYKDATGWRGVEDAKYLKPYHFIYWRVGSKPVICKPVKLVL